MSDEPSYRDHLRSKHATFCSILDDSEETLISFSGSLLEKEVIDRKVNNSVTRTIGIRGANNLVTHIELMVEQRPEVLNTVLEVMEKEKCLEKVAEEIKREMGVELPDKPGATKKPFIPTKPPVTVFQGHFAKVCDVVPETTCTKLGNDLLAAQLLSANVLDNVMTNASLSRYDKVHKYMTEIRRSLVVDNNHQTIVSLSRVLKKQNNAALDKIANSMLTEMGYPIKREGARKERKKRKGGRGDAQTSKSKRKCVANSESDSCSTEDLEDESEESNEAKTLPSSESKKGRKRRKGDEGDAQAPKNKRTNSNKSDSSTDNLEDESEESNEVKTSSSESASCSSQDSVRKRDFLTQQDLPEVTKALGTFPSWFTLGIHLKIPYDDLKMMENNNPRNCEQCKTDMVAAWIKTDKATWKTLVQALRTAKNISKANEIKRKYVN